MAVRIQFISVVIPIDCINNSSYPGGFAGLQETEREHIGKLIWHDDHLLVECAMGPPDVQAIVERWEEYGLTARVGSDDSRYWKDICVVDYYQGPTLPCEWIEFDGKNHAAWHKSYPPGNLVDPSLKHEDNPVMLTPEMMRSARISGVPARSSKPWWKFW